MLKFYREILFSLQHSLVLALLCGLGFSAFAYIPSSRLIFSRMAKDSGKGMYLLEQELQFRGEAEPIVVREKWWIEGAEKMRVSVSSVPGSAVTLRFEALYHDGQRQFWDGQQIREAKIGPEFYLPIFFFRSSANLINYLTRSQVIPQGMGAYHHINARTTPYTAEAGVRLARVAGVVAWAFGDPSPLQGRLLPGLWVEQDAFAIRKLRYPSQAELVANRFTHYAGGLVFPREQRLNWDNESVNIQVISIKALSETAAHLAWLKESSLSSDSRAYRMPEAAQVREFYSRFR